MISPIPNTLLVKQTTRGISPWETFYAVGQQDNNGKRFGVQLSQFTVNGNNVTPASDDLIPDGTFEIVG